MTFLDFETGEEDEPKFEPKHGSECEGCKNIRLPKICRGCDAGEYFEERDPDGLDFIFNN